MAGPVLTHELLLGGRRLRTYTLRWCYAGWLVIQLELLLSTFAPLVRSAQGGGQITEACQTYIGIIVYQQFFLLLLVVPALLAGAIADEKTRGTLQYLLTTDLTVGEILLGKLLVRTSLVGTLALLPLPFLCLAAPFAGLDWLGLLAFAACTAVLLFALGSAGLLASVWARETRTAIVGLYCCLAVAYAVVLFVAGWFPWVNDHLHFLDPMYPLDLDVPRDNLRERGGRLLVWLMPWLALGSASFAVAAWRMLPAYFRQLESSGKKRQRWWTARRPPVSRNPVLWKERHVEGIAPLAVLRALPTWLAVLGVFLLTVLAYGSMLFGYLRIDTLFGFAPELDEQDFVSLFDRITQQHIPSAEFVFRSVWVLLIAALVVGIRCSGAVTGERDRKTWESLLLSPMETRHLIRGKFWGILGATIPYLIAYAVPALAFSLLGGWTSVFITALFLGVTCLAMAFAGSAGIWCSVHSKSSWRSLLETLVWTYVGGACLYCVSSPFIMALALLITLLLNYVDRVFGGPGLNSIRATAFTEAFAVATGIALAVGFLLASWRFLADAEHRVSRKERIKHWRDEDDYVRPRYRGRSRRRRKLEEN